VSCLRLPRRRHSGGLVGYLAYGVALTASSTQLANWLADETGRILWPYDIMALSRRSRPGTRLRLLYCYQ
jgi:hypothetical protein